MQQPLCGFVAATNIADIHSEWECDKDGNYVTNPCGDPQWPGVICTYETDIIYELTFFQDPIVGTLPSSLSELTGLISLSIFESSLFSSIPEEYTKLSKLNTLMLTQNQLTGSLPSDMGLLSNLYLISLDYNYISQAIPTSISEISALSYFIVNDNLITGDIPDLFQDELINLLLENNQLSGTIPESISNMVNGGFLKLDNNNIEGTIPTGIASVTALKVLKLQNTFLSKLDNLFVDCIFIYIYILTTVFFVFHV